MSQTLRVLKTLRVYKFDKKRLFTQLKLTDKKPLASCLAKGFGCFQRVSHLV